MAENKKTTSETAAKTDLTVKDKSKEEMNHSQRFTAAVLKEFGSNVAGQLEISDYQKRLIQGYFIGTDRALKTAEENRIAKNAKNTDAKYNNDLPCKWENVNMADLAVDLMHYAKMGLDMNQDNHLFAVPYKNAKTNKYDVTLMPGYNGIRYMAEKYAVDVPRDVTIELVYSTDNFTPIKKSAGQNIEGYEFEITNAFSRGDIVGGFGYIEYAEPTKNKLILMSLAEIEKRKPKYASPQFWGNSDSDGWRKEMILKTLVREVYSSKYFPRDPKKVDEDYQYVRLREAHYTEVELNAEIDENANKTPLLPPDMPDTVQGVVDEDTGEVNE